MNLGTRSLVAVSLVAMLGGCATDTQTGALIGAGGGAAAGAGIGALAGGGKGAAIGAALGGVTGGVTGAVIGRYMDNQKAELNRQLKSGYVEKKGNKLVVKFSNGILFDTDSSELKSDAQKELGEFADVLNKYPDTNLRIEGYTDNKGSREHNKLLSERRAQAVVDYLVAANVKRARLVSEGLGESHPVSTNATHEGRQANRRVEIHIEANEDLKAADRENAKKNS